VDEIIRDYDADRREIIEARQHKKLDVAKRLTDDFHQKQRLRVTRAEAKADPYDTRVLLVVLAMQLRDGWQPCYEVCKYLSDALIEIARNPAKAAHALGLVPPRRRPTSTEHRDYFIAFRILDLSATQPINAATKNSAIVAAAQEFKVSIAVAERAWKKNSAFVKGWRAAMDAV
jgi:hypothetical protein